MALRDSVQQTPISNEEALENIRKMKAQGLTEAEIANEYGLSISQYRMALANVKGKLHNKKEN